MQRSTTPAVPTARTAQRPSPLAWLARLPVTLLVLLVVFVSVYPVVWIFLSSLKGQGEFTANPMWALPQAMEWNNYARAWTEGNMSKYFVNSVTSVLPALALVIILGTMAAFGIEIMRWKLRNVASLLFLAGIMVPIQVVILPLFTMYFKVHLLDTRLALILTYTVFGLPLVVFFLVGYFKTFAREIIEAAIVDGASIYQVFFRIALPMVTNAIVTVALVQFFFMWNDLLVSLTFIQNPDMRTVQSGLLAFTGQYGQREWGPTFASISLAVAPTVLVYLLLNQLVMKGMAAGAVKG
ncbi:carbohydrate ABC transporter permease [Deinococcus pimensis]|uniref:carbohydrate ABC transporter permease n=1 Tax=Deinococcus pimensis TaxID=309888 RepID=UPI0004818568|nr:carbohydrate ABC transporter permease [Deinococcus pimensis]